jgi:hypothetical protein
VFTASIEKKIYQEEKDTKKTHKNLGNLKIVEEKRCF